jgi:predicted metal-binding membrane protein
MLPVASPVLPAHPIIAKRNRQKRKGIKVVIEALLLGCLFVWALFGMGVLVVLLVKRFF